MAERELVRPSAGGERERLVTEAHVANGLVASEQRPDALAERAEVGGVARPVRDDDRVDAGEERLLRLGEGGSHDRQPSLA